MLFPQWNEHRDLTSLNGLWDFRFERPGDTTAEWSSGFEAEKWVPVPSSFNDLFTTYAEHNHWGAVWYQRSFYLPERWQGLRVVLRFAAAWYAAEVWLNGKRLGDHETGHTPFEFHVTPHLCEGENRIVVRLTTRLTVDTVPQGEIKTDALPWQVTRNHPDANFDFFPYAGLHQPVSLYTTSDHFLDGLQVDTVVSETSASLRLRVCTCGGIDRVRVTIEETGETGEARVCRDEAMVEVIVAQPRLWDVGQPNLYSARVEALAEDGTVVDSYRQTVGIRTIELCKDGLLLNGRLVYLKGFGKHEDFVVIGRGLNEAVNVRDFELMRWVNANSFRTAHYPDAEEMLILADRLGVLVISEAPAVSIMTDQATPRTLATHCAVVREYMERDYNHPSVVLWCVGNECSTFLPSARPYFTEVCKAARSVDSNRPLMHVTCFGLQDLCLDLFDVVGVNMYPGWYGGGEPLDKDTEWVSEFLIQLREAAGGRPLMITEFGADSIVGFHSLPSELWTEDYQRDLVEAVLHQIRKTEGVIGEHLWSFADFRTGQNHTRAWGNRKGVFTRDRQPKAVAHLLKTFWDPARDPHHP